jgi:urease accessory protein
MTTTADDQPSLKDEISDLERRLEDAKTRLNANNPIDAVSTPASDAGLQQPSCHGYRWGLSPSVAG